MSDATSKYWKDCIITALDELNIALTNNEADYLVGAVEGAHENYGMAFYSPSAGDRLDLIREGEVSKLRALREEFEGYKKSVEGAMRRALKVPDDIGLRVTKDGIVLGYGGRTERIL